MISISPKKIAESVSQLFDYKTLSRDLVTALVDRATKQKDVVVDVLANELSAFFSKINVTEEGRKILEGLTFDVHTTINVRRKSKK